MTDRTTAIAQFIRTRRTLDRGQLLFELVETFPEATATEIQEAINARPRPILVLSQNGGATSSGTTEREAAE